MHWTDEAIILSIRKHGEHQALVRLFARQHGVVASIARGAYSKKNRGIWQPGNIVTVNWNARLAEHMGSVTAEMQEPVTAFLLADETKLAALSSACSLLEMILPERHPYPVLYERLEHLLMVLKESRSADRISHIDMKGGQQADPALSPSHGECSSIRRGQSKTDTPTLTLPPQGGGNIMWPLDYIRFELALLAESGFGLDLSSCAATGQTDDLVYVSPKSGRAVSKDAGEPYKEKLFRLPGFLLSSPLGGERARPSPKDAGRAVRGIDVRPQKEKTLIKHSRELRKSATQAERKLWYALCNRQFEGFKFRRQHSIGNRYIADFICLEHKLIVELDGSQHQEQEKYDTERTTFLEAEGYKVLRFWNNDVINNIEGVARSILDNLKLPLTLRASPAARSQLLSPKGRAEELLAGLQLSGYFLEHWLATPHGKNLPAARARLCTLLGKAKAA